MARLSLLLIFCLLFMSCEQQTEENNNYDDYRPLRVSVSQVSLISIRVFSWLFTIYFDWSVNNQRFFFLQLMPFIIVTELPDGRYRFQGIVSKHFYYVAQKLNRP